MPCGFVQAGDRHLTSTDLGTTSGNAVTFDYDTAGNLATVTDAQTGCVGGCDVTIGRNTNGTVASVTDPRGNVTSYGYTSGNRTSIDNPAPLGDVTLGYDSLSRVTSVVDGNGHTTTYGYDTLDRVTSITYQGGSTVTYGYDGVGNRTSRVDPTGTTTTTYDALNRVTAEAFPGSRSTSYSYDGVGNLTSFTDPAGTLTYGYNDVNLLETLTEGTNTTTFGYDDANNRTSTTYPNGVVETADYDDSNRLERITGRDALNAVLTDFTYTYAAAGSGADTALRQTVTDKDGNVTTYGYDPVERLTSAVTRTSAAVETDRHEYTYDPAGNRTVATRSGRDVAADYNAANQLVHTAPEPGATVLVVANPSSPTAADAALKSRLEGLGATVTYRDDSASDSTTGVELVVVSESVAGSTLAGKYAGAAVPVVHLEQAAWDDADLASASGTVASTSSVAVSDAAFPTNDGYHAQLTGTVTHTTSAQNTGRVADTALGAGAAAFLRPTSTSTDVVGFAYDTGDAMANSATAAARRVALGWHSNTITNLSTAGWDAFDNAVSWAAGGSRYTYDNDGQQTGTADAREDLDYNTADQTTSMRTTGNGTALSATYADDGEYERATAGTATYTTSVLGVTAETIGTTTTGYTRDNHGRLLGVRTGVTRGYYLHDGLGSIAAITGTAGTVTNRYTYTPYGQTTETALTGALSNPWRYTSHYFDQTTGLYKAGIRYYQPETARWTQTDPALEAYETDYGNQYLYAAANPANYTDPTGALSGCAVGSIALTVGALALGAATGGALVALGAAAAEVVAATTVVTAPWVGASIGQAVACG